MPHTNRRTARLWPMLSRSRSLASPVDPPRSQTGERARHTTRLNTVSRLSSKGFKKWMLCDGVFAGKVVCSRTGAADDCHGGSSATGTGPNLHRGLHRVLHTAPCALWCHVGSARRAVRRPCCRSESSGIVLACQHRACQHRTAYSCQYTSKMTCLPERRVHPDNTIISRSLIKYPELGHARFYGVIRIIVLPLRSFGFPKGSNILSQEHS